MKPRTALRRLRRHARLLGVVLALGACAPAWADRSTDQVGLAAAGRFDELERQLESQAARGPLDTRDRHALCYTYSRIKRYAKLLDCLDQLQAGLAGGDRSTRLFALEDATPAVGIMRAEALVELGQYANAVREAERTLAWLQDDGSDDLDMVANALAILSVAHTLGGDRDAGLAAAQRIEALRIGFLSAHAGAKAMALARARMALRDYPGVLAALAADKTFALNVFLDRLATGSYFTGVNNWVWVELPRAYMLTKALIETGRAQEARATLERLLALPQTRHNGELYWMLLDERARLAAADQDPRVALASLREAIDTVEQQRASIHTEASKIGFVGDKESLYARAIATALALGEQAQAYELMERAKSRALVDLLAARGAAALQAHDPAARLALQEFRHALDDASVQLPLEAGAAPERARSAAGHAALLKKAHPALASLVSVDTLPLAGVRSHLDARETLVEYHWHGQQLVVMAVTRDALAAAVAPSDGLEQQVRLLREAIIARQDTRELAGALYRRLLAPVAGLVAGRDLVIVPAGILHYLPFGVLHDGADTLLARHGLRFLPSASVQKYLPPARRTPPRQMLVLGNPDLGNAELDLPNAQQEADLIARLVPDSTVLLREQASETRFRELSGRHRYLHLAAHGQFRSANPLASRLALASDGRHDGTLTVSEIYGLRLDADLVTLSACETGLNKSTNGDDLIGMTRGFLYAGSSNIVASLWEVDDAATAELMQQFYRNLLAGQSKRAALREAQLALRARRPDPLHWAAFYLTGNGE
ncbi:CHAT domain-containing protein [Massilia niastensis]|uniref:CHAT domain-containing protein n=1 Tax=Massilia niastensis TaxID=544911 RepID=UPI00036471CA|nr:CHAT domain-containing protein [Massilia niastensis]